ASYPQFDPRQPATYLQALSHNNLLWRLHAQRLIVEHQCQELVPSLLKLLSDGNQDACKLNVGAIHALWTLQGLNYFRENAKDARPAMIQALQHPSYAVRKNAVLVLPATPEAAQCLADSPVLEDSDPSVQKAILLRLSDLPAQPWMIRYLARNFGNQNWTPDRGLMHAYIIAAAAHAPLWLQALTHYKGDRPEADWLRVVEQVAAHAARTNSMDTVRALLETLEKMTPDLQVRLLEGWIRGTPSSAKLELTEADEKRLQGILLQVPQPTARLLISLALRWNSQLARNHAQIVRQHWERDVVNQQLDMELRLRSAHQLAELFKEDRALVRFLAQQLSPQASPDWVGGIAAALVKMSAPGLVEELIQAYKTLTPAGKKALLTHLFTREEWLPQLLAYLDKGVISPGDLSLEQRQALLQHRDKNLAALASKVLSASGSLPSPDRQKVIEAYAEVTKLPGDPAAGRKIFQAHCAKCHTYQGEGGKVGPDLTGMAVHTKEHLLVEIFDPSRSVEGNYRQYILATKSGKVLSGLLVAESKTVVELLDSEGKTHTVPREEIEELQVSSKSLMPEGFEQQLKPQEVADLLAFLTHREKYVPLSLERAATAISTRGMFYREDALQERLVFSDWKPKTYKGVPFHLIDPQGDRVPNVILLHSSQGTFPPKMPKSVELPCNLAVDAIHMLSGVSGWGFPLGQKGSVSLIVRLHYADGETEDHLLRNGEHFADYIRRVDVPGSEFAFALRQQQIRYLVIRPKRPGQLLRQIQLIKGTDDTAPIIMAITVELSKSKHSGD
ncbi:MAG: c-type cytochrome, partial [Gemmatales bacterium]|nr:c-type cytochrome [Gemmatales bacterium]